MFILLYHKMAEMKYRWARNFNPQSLRKDADKIRESAAGKVADLMRAIRPQIVKAAKEQQKSTRFVNGAVRVDLKVHCVDDIVLDELCKSLRLELQNLGFSGAYVYTTSPRANDEGYVELACGFSFRRESSDDG